MYDFYGFWVETVEKAVAPSEILGTTLAFRFRVLDLEGTEVWEVAQMVLRLRHLCMARVWCCEFWSVGLRG